MGNEIKSSCKHKYIVGYSLRMPQPFFRSLPCDNCGSKIKLRLPWRVLYTLIDIVGLIFAYSVAASVHVVFFRNTFFVSLVIFVLLVFIIEQLNRLVLQYGKWVELK